MEVRERGALHNNNNTSGSSTLSVFSYRQLDRESNLFKDEYELVDKLSVESNDLIETGKGLTNITFDDNTQVKIKENSKLIIDDFVYDSKPRSVNRLALKVALGTVRYASGGIAKNNGKHVDIQTPVATIAVRGTEFSMVVNEIGGSTVILLPNFNEPKF
jgi:hypothetical protein